ncbi:gamma-glutamyl-gamma-aminobutyrate hydrolase family protein [Agrococcus citreus]|uniref:Gamma-glutamyl-gamma-aminobutyrate hydrolase family protein n=1 Tax=Agrococcus citreus TaxID=84643 RepID=A0ABN1YZD4_9MICO
MRPFIAVVADRKPQSSGAWVDVPTDGLPHSYVRAIEQAGGAAVLIPAVESHLDELDRLLDCVDGLFLAGGRDIDAELYGQRPHPANDPSLTVRDRLEIALTQRASERGIPVFGACRGMQVINVAFGGTLEQHLADRVDMQPHRDGVGEFTSHRVEIVAGSALATIAPHAELDIASHHHQGVDALGEGLIATAFADDGVIEAVETPTGFCVGVQWHPEEQLDHEGHALVLAFVDAARQHAERNQHGDRS